MTISSLVPARRIAAAIACLLFAPAAFANSSANADIAAPLRAANTPSQSATGAQDEQFSKLFSSWQSFEGNNVPALASVAEAQSQAGLRSAAIGGPRQEVSIPSLIPLAHMTVTSSFGMRVNPVTGRLLGHKGIDLAAPIGTPVYASADGMVSRASWFSSYGLFVSIEHGGKLQTRYGHMSKLNVAEGERVHKGDVIGFVGSTGRSTGPHLHYEVRIDGEAVSPVPYMNGHEQLASASTDPSLGRGGPE